MNGPFYHVFSNGSRAAGNKRSASHNLYKAYSQTKGNGGTKKADAF
jgi:hypothetical protein